MPSQIASQYGMEYKQRLIIQLSAEHKTWLWTRVLQVFTHSLISLIALICLKWLRAELEIQIWFQLNSIEWIDRSFVECLAFVAPLDCYRLPSFTRLVFTWVQFCSVLFIAMAIIVIIRIIGIIVYLFNLVSLRLELHLTPYPSQAYKHQESAQEPRSDIPYGFSRVSMFRLIKSFLNIYFLSFVLHSIYFKYVFQFIVRMQCISNH